MPHSPQQMADYEKKLAHIASLMNREVPLIVIAERLGIGRGAAYRLAAVVRARGLAA